MKTIVTHWSADNHILTNQLTQQIESHIQTHWKNVRYKRLWFYFFEKEIREDTKDMFQDENSTEPHHLLDPEYQALIARSAYPHQYDYQTRDELTLLVNDYIFGQGQFFGLDYVTADQTIVQALIQYLNQTETAVITLNADARYMSDVLLQLRRVRADVAIVSQIYEGQHTYQTLMKLCTDYVGTFACLPRFVELFPTGWSMTTIMQAIDHPEQLATLLEPNYTLQYALIPSDHITPYGYLQPQATVYSNWLSRLGHRWTHQDWYIKLMVSLGIVWISRWFGGWSLVILPILWGLLAVARTQSNYLTLFQQMIGTWYNNFDAQHQKYLKLYHYMIDPAKNTDETIKAQKLINNWYDIIPFTGQESTRDATEFAKKLYKYIVSFSKDDSITNTIAFMDALSQWGQDHHLPLLIVKDNQFAEQSLYRFLLLLDTMKRTITISAPYEDQWVSQYDSIDEMITTKKHNFWWWTSRYAVSDGIMVAISSGLMGWMGSYLWNWSVSSTSAFAAGPSLTLPTPLESDNLFDEVELLTQLKTRMTDTQIENFLDAVKKQQSPTLWDTMVDLFGYKQGNQITNHFMDSWWRISDDQIHSKLFQLTLDDMPTSIYDKKWDDMLHFLHRIYGYENLQHYQDLLTQHWFPDTIRSLKNGSLSVQDFASLPVEQREIVTQALFYYLRVEELEELFTFSAVVPRDEVITPIITGNIQTGTVDIPPVIEVIPEPELPVEPIVPVEPTEPVVPVEPKVRAFPNEKEISLRTQFVSFLTTGISDGWNALTNWTSGLWSSVGSTGQGIGASMLAAFQNLGTNLADLAGWIWDSVVMSIQWIANLIRDGLTALFSGLGAFFASLRDGLIGLLGNFGVALDNFLTGLFTGLKNFLSDIRASLTSALHNGLAGLWNWLVNLFTGLFDAIVSLLYGIWDRIINLLAGLWSSLTNFFSSFWNWLSNLFVGRSLDGLLPQRLTNRNLGAWWDSISDIFRRGHIEGEREQTLLMRLWNWLTNWSMPTTPELPPVQVDLSGLNIDTNVVETILSGVDDGLNFTGVDATLPSEQATDSLYRVITLPVVKHPTNKSPEMEIETSSQTE